jgi:hypothetical protein
MISLIVSLGAWLFGFASFGNAVMIYLGTGVSVFIAGLMSAGLSALVTRFRGPARTPVKVRIDVRLADRH